MDTQQILRCINERLAHVCDGRQPAGLYDPIRYVLSTGGKRLRPTLMMLAYGMYKDDPESIVTIACGIETYHNYTLLHDDLMDKASMRRGHATVHERWDDNTAILSGDTMMVMAYEMMQTRSEVMPLFTRTALEIGEGQRYDMDFERRNDVSEDEYIEMIRLKTAVLPACSLKTGAMLAGAPDADADALYAFGEKIGLAFQLQDDYLDVYGDPEVFGKNIGGDILSNKKTYMLINAMNAAQGAVHDELMMWINADSFDEHEKIAAVTGIYNKTGIGRMALDKIDAYFDESRKYMDMLSVSDERKQALIAYTDAMMKREK